jgi:LPXTG-motif cell wall-anchored protein
LDSFGAEVGLASWREAVADFEADREAEVLQLAPNTGVSWIVVVAVGLVRLIAVGAVLLMLRRRHA